MGQQELAFCCLWLFNKELRVCSRRRLLKCRGKQMLLHGNTDPLVFRGLVWSGPWDKGRGGLISSVYASAYLYMFRICSLILYLHVFMGLVLGKVKKLRHPKLTLDLLPVCLTFPFQASPRQEMRRLCFRTLWSYRFGLTRVRFTQKSSETPGEHCRVSVQLLFERLSWGGVYCSCSQERIPWTCISSAFSLESWKFVLDAVGRRNTPSRDSDCGKGRVSCVQVRGCLVHRNLLQDIKDLYFRTF